MDDLLHRLASARDLFLQKEREYGASVDGLLLEKFSQEKELIEVGGLATSAGSTSWSGRSAGATTTWPSARSRSTRRRPSSSAWTASCAS